jgi:putative ABC transport system substrate-binding protein
MSGLVSAAATWPLAARAQQPERMRRIGIFMPGTATIRNFRTATSRSYKGWPRRAGPLGRNARFDYRWGAGQIERETVTQADFLL